MPHPGDDGGFGTLPHRDSLRPGDRATSDRCGMIGDGTGKPDGEFGVRRMERQESQHGLVEVPDVFGLGLVSASGIGFLAFGVPLGGPFGFEFSTDLIDGRCRCPSASGEDLSALLLLDAPMLSSRLHSAGQGGIAGRKRHPALGCGQDSAIG